MEKSIDWIRMKLHAKIHFPLPYSQFPVVSNRRSVGLTENYRLYSNTSELAHNCKSYFIHDETILVYSTLQQQLAFRSLINEHLFSEIYYRKTLLNKQNEYNEKFQEFINILENNRLYQLAVKQFLSNQQIKTTMNYMEVLRTNLFQNIKEIFGSGRDYNIDENDDRRTLATRTNIDCDDSDSIQTRLTKTAGSSQNMNKKCADRQDLEIVLGDEHISFSTSKICSLIDINNSLDPDS
ncbi:unnamed protein product [Rotaria magnacalcarata]|uniref:ELP1 N-terminal second beta-propeller domain-containing protein n=4 Tax=Rotaria magnacalcarata TaxID=392030 RepID=A0A816MRL8_9BILA|nr:unnamed protein product [Rotaria magnacalcarata]